MANKISLINTLVCIHKNNVQIMQITTGSNFKTDAI